MKKIKNNRSLSKTECKLGENIKVNNYVLKVEDVFEIKGKGVVIIGKKDDCVFELKQGDLIEIINPNGNKTQSLVQGIEKTTRQCFTPTPVTTVAILLDASFNKESVVSDAIVYCVENNTKF